MKKVLLVALIALLFTSCMMYSLVDVSKMGKEKEIVVDNLSKDDLYVKANMWLVGYFVDSRSVIHFRDKEAGVIMGKYLVYHRAAASYMSAMEVTATVTITIKNNFIKLEVKPHPYYDQLREGYIDNQLEALITSFTLEFQN